MIFLLVFFILCENKLAADVLVNSSCQNAKLEKKIKVGLLVDEFFGGAGTAVGGLGFLAREFVAKYIPNENIKIDVLLGGGHHSKMKAQEYHVDNVTLFKLPYELSLARSFLKKKNYDIYLSLEIQRDFILKCEPDQNKKLILWIQDPRPKSEWDNVINTMQSIKEPCYYRQELYDFVNELVVKNRVKFISQGYSLNPLAMELYRLPSDTRIQYVPNPVDIDFSFQFNISTKKKQVMYLGRLAGVKRPWLFCEVAKKMPEYEFIVVGKIKRQPEDNQRMLDPYMNGKVSNLHFLGHVEGEKKIKLLKESRVLLSTSIHEGISIAWLEALSYGTLVVSNLEREKLIEQFGAKAPDLLGDGFDGVDTFIPLIRNLLENDELFSSKAKAAIEYVRRTHNISRFTNDLREILINETRTR